MPMGENTKPIISAISVNVENTEFALESVENNQVAREQMKPTTEIGSVDFCGAIALGSA